MIRRTCSKNYSLSREFEFSCIIRSGATSGSGGGGRRRRRRRRRSNLTVRKVQVQVPSRSIAVCRRLMAGIINRCTLTPPPSPSSPSPWRQTFQTNISLLEERRRKQPRSTLFFIPVTSFLKRPNYPFQHPFFNIRFELRFVETKVGKHRVKISNIYSLDIYILRSISFNRILSICHLRMSIPFITSFRNLLD